MGPPGKGKEGREEGGWTPIFQTWLRSCVCLLYIVRCVLASDANKVASAGTISHMSHTHSTASRRHVDPQGLSEPGASAIIGCGVQKRLRPSILIFEPLAYSTFDHLYSP